ncbi:MAG: rod-binding protein [Planctomycetota bacterium]
MRIAPTGAGAGTISADVREKVSELVSFTFSQMIRSMRATIPDDPYFSSGSAEDIFRQMQDGEWARALSDRVCPGFADDILRGLEAKKSGPEGGGAAVLSADPRGAGLTALLATRR